MAFSVNVYQCIVDVIGTIYLLNNEVIITKCLILCSIRIHSKPYHMNEIP